eukprot:gene31638-36231_t
MISARQIRAARALLGWSQQDLADKAIVSLNAVVRIETGKVDPRLSTLTAIEAALTKGGVEFIQASARAEANQLHTHRFKFCDVSGLGGQLPGSC